MSQAHFFHKRYQQATVIALAITTAGILLQWIFGAFDLTVLVFPLHAYLFVGILVFTVLATLLFRRNTVVQFLSGGHAAITSILMLSFWALVMGLTVQLRRVGDDADWLANIGVRQMCSFWPFILSYLYLLICLSFATCKRLRTGFHFKNICFFFNHAGLLLLLYFTGFGAADVRQYRMQVSENQTEWRGETDMGELVELPIAIELHDFHMDLYAPKLLVMHNTTKKILSAYMDVDTIQNQGRLLDWRVEIERFLPKAIRTSDTTYQALRMPGTCPAAYIRATHRVTGEEKQSWVASGNHLQLYMTLDLNDSTCIVMTEAEPKAYYSDVSVYIRDGNSVSQCIEVNSPLRFDHWMIYQSDYDKIMGADSITSIFDLVFDPWSWWVYASCLMLSLGACMLFWGNHHTKKNSL